MHESLRQFHPVIGKWFEEKVGIPTPPQVLGWPVIGAVGGEKSALIVAPTGSGKTLAAFLGAIDWLVRKIIAAEAAGKGVWGVQIVYVSPLKALANDVRKNLIKPLEELAEVAAGMGVSEWPEVRVGVRTGDTPQRERAMMVKKPPHILITTPESLNLMVTTGARGIFGGVKFLIVDEVHALAGGKRGVFLSLVLERLEYERRRNHEGTKGRRTTKSANNKVKVAPGVYMEGEDVGEMVRVGLSATARPAEVIAGWLAGFDEEGKGRAMEVVKTGQRKRLDLGVVCPFGGGGVEDESLTDENGQPKVKGTGHWPEVTRAVLGMIRMHKSTLIFANSRRLIERLAARFQEELEGEKDERRKTKDETQESVPVILPHHGSISREVRLETEQALKRGEVDAVLATSSLELGIDIGALDLVVQIDSPGNVAAGLQRVGRAGHLEKATAKGRFLARGLYELPSFGALLPLMEEGVVEETRVPENCLDVLAQQIVAACVGRPWKRGELYRVVRRAMPYARLTEKQFDTVVAMLSKRAERVTSQGLRPRISFDRVNDELIIMPGAGKVLLMNSGVIADTGQFPVYLAGATRGRMELGEGAPREEAQARWGEKKGERDGLPGVRLGELDEEFVYETKEGDRIILGSQTWRVVRIDADQVLVERAEPGSSRMPFWRGESAPRSEMLGEGVARFNGEIERRLGGKGKAANEERVEEWLMRTHRFDEQAAANAVGFYERQIAKGAVPTDARIVVEHFIDRAGEPIIAILCPLGSRVNYGIRLALEGQFARRRLPAQVVHHDDGLIIRPPGEVAGGGEVPENPLVWLKSRTLEAEIVDLLEGTALFGLRFRQNAARALMLPRMTLSQRTPLWQQRLRARHLLALVKRQRNFPVMVETYRECLQEALNLPKVVELLGRLERGEMTVKMVHHHDAGESSPFARSLFSQFTQAFLYEQDDPLVPVDIEPAVDPQVLDEILRKREGADGETRGRRDTAKGWGEDDEKALSRRIVGADYPARSAEELLEKIEAAGAAGVEFGGVEDARWEEWVVGGGEEARRMVSELSEKRRVLRVEVKTKKTGRWQRWVAAENLALLLAARGGELVKLERLGEGKGMRLVAYDELPSVLLETELSPEDARQVIVEQALKRVAITTRHQVIEALPWMKEAAGIVEELVRAGKVLEVGEKGEVVWGEYAEVLRGMALRRQRRGAATVDLAALQRHLIGWQRVMPAANDSEEKKTRDAESGMGVVDAAEDVLDMMMGEGFSLEMWEHEILRARVKDFSPAILEGISGAGSGRWVWVGKGQGEVMFWPRHLLGQRPAAVEGELSEIARRVEQLLKERGASFQFDMQMELGSEEGDLALALRALVFAGHVSNDQLQSLREVLRVAEVAERDGARKPASPRLHATHARHVPRPAKMPRNWWRQAGASGSVTAGSLGGRWFLVPAPTAPTDALDRAARAADRVDRFLRRTGFACRELLDADVDGPWKDAYDVLTRMEWGGSVRRGYFVDGIAGSQFALPGVHLETPADDAVVWLSMLDPANVWARASTRWVSDTGLAARVPRVAGSWVAMVAGRPVLAAVSWGQRLIPLPAPEAEQQRALQTLASLFSRFPRDSHPYMAVRHWDQQDIAETAAAEILRQQGFTRDPQGLRLYRRY